MPTVTAEQLEAARDHYMSLLRDEYNRLKIVELTENLGNIDDRLNTFLSDRVPYLAKNDRSGMVSKLLYSSSFNSDSNDMSSSSSTAGRVDCGQLSRRSSTNFRGAGPNTSGGTNCSSPTPPSSSRSSLQFSTASANNNDGGGGGGGVFSNESGGGSGGRNEPGNEMSAALFGQVYAHRMCVYVLRLNAAISEHTVRWEQLAVEEDAPEDIILYSLVTGRGELILFGGMRSDAGTGMDCLNATYSDRHAMSSDTWILRPRYSDI